MPNIICPNCSNQLDSNAKFCSKCGYRIQQTQQQTTPAPQAIQQVTSQLTGQLGGLSAPIDKGEFTLDLPEINNITNAVSKAKSFGVKNILAGLAAGGVSFGALYGLKTEHPIIISVCVSALAVGARLAVAMVRRAKK